MEARNIDDEKEKRMKAKITAIDVKDIRFPTSLNRDGSDAMHTDPDYSCVYVTIKTSKKGCEGYGLTFTLGRGTEIVVQACNALAKIVLNRKLKWIYKDFANFWRRLTSDSQLRWVGPEKGVIHLATAAIVNALWDLWARVEEKPVWKLLSDMSPEELVSVIDFRYVKDIVDEKIAIKILEEKMKLRQEQKKKLQKNGYPAYTTQVGWLGYSDDKLKDLCKSFLDSGYTAFKIKVGQDLDRGTDVTRRCLRTRSDSQRIKAVQYRSGHRRDVRESRYVQAVPVCPHAGGVGLCEMVQHLQMWDYVCLSQTTENRMIEYVDQQHEHFEDPVRIRNAHYMPPERPGYSTKLKEETISEYAYPDGNYWKNKIAKEKETEERND